MRKLFNFCKSVVTWIVIFTTICWSISLPTNLTFLLPTAQAMGGIEIMYTFESGMPDNVFLSSSATPESIMKITAYETQAGANTIDSITIQIDQDMNCNGGSCTESPFIITDLGSISLASTSGISLWRDDGDGTFELMKPKILLFLAPPPPKPVPGPRLLILTTLQTLFGKQLSQI